MKIGLFTLSFVDLESFVGYLPFQLVRTYDSRDKRVGDFGVGWQLSVKDVRIEKSGKIGAYWTQAEDNSGFFLNFCLSPAKSASVTATFPGGRQSRFRAKSSPECQQFTNLTATDIAWENVSDPGNPTIKLVAAGATASSSSVFVQGKRERARAARRQRLQHLGPPAVHADHRGRHGIRPRSGQGRRPHHGSLQEQPDRDAVGDLPLLGRACPSCATPRGASRRSPTPTVVR